MIRAGSEGGGGKNCHVRGLSEFVLILQHSTAITSTGYSVLHRILPIIAIEVYLEVLKISVKVFSMVSLHN